MPHSTPEIPPPPPQYREPLSVGTLRLASGFNLAPLAGYTHAGLSSAAITGAAFCTSNQYPAGYQGSFFFADYLNGFMRRVDSSGVHWTIVGSGPRESGR